MLRITSIAGFTLIILGLIATIAIRVLAVGENAVFDDSPISDWAQRIDAVLFSPQYRAYVGSAITLLLLGWVAACLYFAKRCDEWERKWVKTFIVGCSIMMCFFFILAIVGMSFIAIIFALMPEEKALIGKNGNNANASNDDNL